MTMSEKLYEVVHYFPNPVVDWKVPIAFILDDNRCVAFEGTMPIGLPNDSWNFVHDITIALEQSAGSDAIRQTLASLGPHFTWGSYEIPSGVEDVEAWVRSLYQERRTQKEVS